MSIVVPADAVKPAGGGPGWARTVLADPELVGTAAMALERWTLDPGAEGPELIGRDRERFLYVIGGSGVLVGEAGDLGLAVETIVWLEPGDRLRPRAGDDGLDVLVAEAGEAPAETVPTQAVPTEAGED
ncbi:MAG TPA: hypothetical protein VF984_06485 [Actinomycetota bacterium]